MEGKVSAIILVIAFAVAAGACAMLTLKLWHAGSAGSHPGQPASAPQPATSELADPS